MYYVVNARLPSKKAYGIQIAKMCEAFREADVDLELVIPATGAARASSMRDFYGLRVAVPTVALWTPDWYHRGRIGYAISALIFSFGLFFFFIWRRLCGVRGFYYSVPDRFSYLAASLCALPRVVEIHEPQQFHPEMLSAAKVIATNGEIARALEEMGVRKERMLIEPNGVDTAIFDAKYSKSAARADLRIPEANVIAVYVGRFYQWKGLEILADAATLRSDIQWYVVGGSPEEFKSITKTEQVPTNLHIVGEVAPAEVPRWLAAADVLLVLGTKKNETSYRYTAPMKLYEYMAAQRPIVASETPALQSMVGDGLVHFYEPDDAKSLVESVQKARVSEPPLGHAWKANLHTWKKRTENIKAEIAKI